MDRAPGKSRRPSKPSRSTPYIRPSTSNPNQSFFAKVADTVKDFLKPSWLSNLVDSVKDAEEAKKNVNPAQTNTDAETSLGNVSIPVSQGNVVMSEQSYMQQDFSVPSSSQHAFVSHEQMAVQHANFQKMYQLPTPRLGQSYSNPDPYSNMSVGPMSSTALHSVSSAPQAGQGTVPAYFANATQGLGGVEPQRQLQSSVNRNINDRQQKAKKARLDYEYHDKTSLNLSVLASSFASGYHSSILNSPDLDRSSYYGGKTAYGGASSKKSFSIPKLSPFKAENKAALKISPSKDAAKPMSRAAKSILKTLNLPESQPSTSRQSFISQTSGKKRAAGSPAHSRYLPSSKTSNLTNENRLPTEQDLYRFSAITPIVSPTRDSTACSTEFKFTQPASVSDLPGKATSMSTGPSTSSTSTTQGFASFLTNPSGWSCDTCMVCNPSDVDKCKCCNASKPAAKNKASSSAPNASAAPPTSSASTSQGFASFLTNPSGWSCDTSNTQGFASFLTNPSGWSCDTCMVNNPSDVEKCKCCNTSKPATKNKATTNTPAPTTAPPMSSASTSQGFASFLTNPSGWSCDTCMANNPSDVDKCKCCSAPKPATKNTANSTPAPATAPPMSSASTSQGFASFLTNPSGWSCDTCMVSNPSDVDKCKCCTAPKPTTKNKATSTPAPASSAASTSQGFASFQTKPSGWSCGTCLVNNPSDVDRCECCSASKPAAKNNATTAASTSQGFASFLTNPSGWSCDTCMVNNPSDVDKCKCCNASKPAAKNKAASMSAPAAATQGFASFLAKPSGWSCDTCLVNNPSDVDKCKCCNTPKPVADNKSTRAATSHNADQLAKEQEKNLKVSGFGSLSETSGWPCSTCLVQNSSEAQTCVCCSTAKPVEKVTDASASGSEGSKQNLNVPNAWVCLKCLAKNPPTEDKCSCCSGSKPPIHVSNPSKETVPSFLKDAAQKSLMNWKCATCFVSNTGDVAKCKSCSANKPGTQSSLGVLGKGSTLSWFSGNTSEKSASLTDSQTSNTGGDKTGSETTGFGFGTIGSSQLSSESSRLSQTTPSQSTASQSDKSDEQPTFTFGASKLPGVAGGNLTAFSAIIGSAKAPEVPKTESAPTLFVFGSDKPAKGKSSAADPSQPSKPLFSFGAGKLPSEASKTPDNTSPNAPEKSIIVFGSNSSGTSTALDSSKPPTNPAATTGVSITAPSAPTNSGLVTGTSSIFGSNTFTFGGKTTSKIDATSEAPQISSVFSSSNPQASALNSKTNKKSEPGVFDAGKTPAISSQLTQISSGNPYILAGTAKTSFTGYKYGSRNPSQMKSSCSDKPTAASIFGAAKPSAEAATVFKPSSLFDRKLTFDSSTLSKSGSAFGDMPVLGSTKTTLFGGSTSLNPAAVTTTVTASKTASAFGSAGAASAELVFGSFSSDHRGSVFGNSGTLANCNLFGSANRQASAFTKPAESSVHPSSNQAGTSFNIPTGASSTPQFNFGATNTSGQPGQLFQFGAGSSTGAQTSDDESRSKIRPGTTPVVQAVQPSDTTGFTPGTSNSSQQRTFKRGNRRLPQNR